MTNLGMEAVLGPTQLMQPAKLQEAPGFSSCTCWFLSSKGEEGNMSKLCGL